MKKIIDNYINYPIRFIYKRICNLIRWFPIIWNDRDWDSWYIFTILETKIKHQAKYIGDRDFHMSAKRDAEIMMTCVRLIQKIKEEEYEGEYTDYHKSTYNWLDTPEDSDLVRLEINQIDEWFDDYFLKYPLDYKRVLSTPVNQVYMFDDDLNDTENKQHIAMNMSRLRQERAHKLLFKILENNIKSWWD
jgi:hypothetical protein